MLLPVGKPHHSIQPPLIHRFRSQWSVILRFQHLQKAQEIECQIVTKPFSSTRLHQTTLLPQKPIQQLQSTSTFRKYGAAERRCSRSDSRQGPRTLRNTSYAARNPDPGRASAIYEGPRSYRKPLSPVTN
jgi:hypothetical protein